MSTLKKSLSLVLAMLMLISVFTVAPLTAGAADTNKRSTKADIEKKTTGNSFKSGDYSYYLNEDGTAEIYEYNGSDEELVIPDTLDGHKVVSISDNAFWNNEFIKAFKIPDSVTHIGSWAFLGTDFYYNDANWENGVLYIGKFLIAADNITGTYTIKDGTTVIADEAFSEYHDYIGTDGYAVEYSKIEKIIIPDSLTHIGSEAFKNCQELTSVTLPNELKSIGDRAFESCLALNSISIPNGLKSIEEGTFESCSTLKSINIPNGVTTIGYEAFKNCSSLNSVTIPSSVKEIGEGAFYDTGIYKNPSNWNNGVLYYGKYLLAAKRDVVTGAITIKAGTELIACFALCNCNISSVTIPDSVKYINYGAFYQCRNLANVKIGKNVKEIGEYAFEDTALKSVTIPANVTTIGKLAFGYLIEEYPIGYGDYDSKDVKADDFTINGYEKTAAEKYAKDNEFKFVKLTPPKKIKQANTLKVSAKTKAVKAKKLKKKKQTVKPLSIKDAKGAVNVTKVKKGSAAKIFKKIKVNKKTGAITIKKGKYAKKTYKIKLKITAKGNSDYNSKTLTKVVKIKVK